MNDKSVCPYCGKYVVSDYCIHCNKYTNPKKEHTSKIKNDGLWTRLIAAGFFVSFISYYAPKTQWGDLNSAWEVIKNILSLLLVSVLISGFATLIFTRITLPLFRLLFGVKKNDWRDYDDQEQRSISEQEKLDEEALLGHPSSKLRRKTSKKNQKAQGDQKQVEGLDDDI